MSLARTTSLCIVFIFLTTALALNTAGKHARTYAAPQPVSARGIPVHILKNERELYGLYKSLGIRGRIMVHLGRYLHFVDIEPDALLAKTDRFPIQLFNMLDRYEGLLSDRNVLWTAMQANLLREIDYVLPAPMFEERKRSLAASRTDVLSISHNRIVAHDWGSRRTLSPVLPDLTEPVLLNIDASYLEEADEQAVYAMLAASQLKADVLTVTLSEDNPEISAVARQRLIKLADLFAVR